MQCGAYFYEIAHVDGALFKFLPDSFFITIGATKE
jgi:hypothetical protein